MTTKEDQILEAALDYAAAVTDYQKAIHLGVDAEVDAATQGSNLARTRNVLLDLSSVELLSRTMERDRLRHNYDCLVEERDDLLAKVQQATNNNGLAQRYTELSDRYNAVELERQGLESRYEDALTAIRSADRRLAEFKEKVVEVASGYAQEHGWCDVIDDALRELGLERKAKKYSGTLTIVVSFEAELEPGKETPSRQWVRDSVSVDTESIEGALKFDSDHTESNVLDVTYQFSDIRDAS